MKQKFWNEERVDFKTCAVASRALKLDSVLSSIQVSYQKPRELS
jgi:hypothetical protein